jgi:hypothetical protein
MNPKQELRTMTPKIAAETHEEWMEGSRYLNMDQFKEQIRQWPKLAAA